jgi:hypothetical protein
MFVKQISISHSVIQGVEAMKLRIFMAYSLLMCVGMRGLAKLRAFLRFYYCLLKQRRMSCTHIQALELMLLPVTTANVQREFSAINFVKNKLRNSI